MKILFSCVALILSFSVTFLPQSSVASPQEQAINKLLHTDVKSPPQLDALWLAYFTYKDLRCVDKIIQTYVKTVINPAFDVTDIFILAESSGTDEYKQKHLAVYKALPDKYPTTKARVELIVAAAALWSLGSNARQDAVVDQHIQQYIANTPHTLITVPLKLAARKRQP